VHPIVVSGDGQVQVPNTLTDASVAVSVTYSVKSDINADPYVPPTPAELDAQAKSAYADATKRTASVLKALGNTEAIRVQTTSVSLQQTYIWVPSQNQQFAVGYIASTSVSFRIASAAQGTLLADLISAGATGINSVSHTAEDSALESGKQKAIAQATSRAVARAKVAARALSISSISPASGPALEFRSLSVSTGSSAPPPVPQRALGVAALESPSPVPSDDSASSDSPGQTTVRAAATLTANLVGYNLL